jgi:hypothetical protein
MRVPVIASRLPIAVAAGFAVLNGVRLLQSVARVLETDALYRRDFTQDYLWARAARDGLNPYEPVSALAQRYLGDVQDVVFSFPTPHPPTLGVLLLPFGTTDLFTASIIWLGIELLCLVITSALLIQSRRSVVRWMVAVFTALALVNWIPVTIDLLTGQLMLPMLLLLAGARSALLKMGHSVTSGALFGLALCLKPVAIPLALVYVRARDYRALLATVAVPTFALFVATLIIGIPPLVHYVVNLRVTSSDYRGFVGNISLWSIGPRLFLGTSSPVQVGVTAPPIVYSETAAAVCTLLIVGGFLAVLIFFSLRARGKEKAFDTLTCASIVMSPIAWDHYLVLALLPIGHAARGLAAQQFPRAKTRLGLFILGFLLVPMFAWIALAQALAGVQVPLGQEAHVPFPATLVTFIPTLTVVALTFYVANLEPGHPHNESSDLACNSSMTVPGPRQLAPKRRG